MLLSLRLSVLGPKYRGKVEESSMMRSRVLRGTHQLQSKQYEISVNSLLHSVSFLPFLKTNSLAEIVECE